MGMTDIPETRVGLTEQMAKTTTLTMMMAVVVLSLLGQEELQTRVGEHLAVAAHPAVPRMVRSLNDIFRIC